MNDNGHIVCGWFTPDYASHAAALIKSLNALGEPHDIVAVPQTNGGWEATTLRKPTQILGAVMRHRTKTVIFLDVDCVVMRPLAELARTRADVAVHLRCQRKSRGNGRIFARSGTMVFRQTAAAVAMLATWINISRQAPPGYTDQYTLAEAIVRTPTLMVENLGIEWCATERDNFPDPSILHTSASKATRKMPAWMKTLHHVSSQARRRLVKIGAVS